MHPFHKIFRSQFACRAGGYVRSFPVASSYCTRHLHNFSALPVFVGSLVPLFPWHKSGTLALWPQNWVRLAETWVLNLLLYSPGLYTRHCGGWKSESGAGEVAMVLDAARPVALITAAVCSEKKWPFLYYLTSKHMRSR